MSRIVYAGTPAIAAEALRGIIEAGFDVVGVLTRPDAPRGRKRTPTPSPVAHTAHEAGIPVIKADQIDHEVSEQLSTWEPSLGIVVAYGALLPPTTLQIPTRGWVNLHYSDLPKYRGAAPVQHAILNDEPRTAATVFQLEAGMDTGPIHGRTEYRIPEMTSSGTALTELTDLGTQLLIELIPALLTGSSQPIEQSDQPSFAPKLTRNDAYIDPTQSAVQVANRINATIPEPGAWTRHGDTRIKFGVARAYAGDVDAPAGEVRTVDDSVIMATGDGRGVVLSQVQPAGKQMMNAADWLRGLQSPAHLGGADG